MRSVGATDSPPRRLNASGLCQLTFFLIHALACSSRPGPGRDCVPSSHVAAELPAPSCAVADAPGARALKVSSRARYALTPHFDRMADTKRIDLLT
jgi:hypothetical protein